MKYNVTINQKAVIDLNLDLDFQDMAIFDLFKDAFPSSKIISTIHNNKKYILFNWKFVINQLPLLTISSKTGIHRRIDKLVKAEVLERCKDNGYMQGQYIGAGRLYEKILFSKDLSSYSDEEVQQPIQNEYNQENSPIHNYVHPPTQKSTGPIHNYVPYNNTIDNNTINNNLYIEEENFSKENRPYKDSEGNLHFNGKPDSEEVQKEKEERKAFLDENVDKEGICKQIKKIAWEHSTGKNWIDKEKPRGKYKNRLEFLSNWVEDFINVYEERGLYEPYFKIKQKLLPFLNKKYESVNSYKWNELNDQNNSSENQVYKSNVVNETFRTLNSKEIGMIKQTVKTHVINKEKHNVVFRCLKPLIEKKHFDLYIEDFKEFMDSYFPELELKS